MTQDRDRLAPVQHLGTGDGVQLALYHWPCPQGDKPLVLLLHGYPDSAQVWAEVAPQLAAAYPVAAYDVRGAGRSTRPRALSAYRMPQLLDDLLGVINALSPEQPVHLVGHDLGSVQGWAALGDPRFDGRIASFTSISGPGLPQFGAWFRRRVRQPRTWPTLCAQALRSWYVALFQLPLLPSLLWRALLGRLWPQYLRWVEGVRQPPVSPTQAQDGADGVAIYRANVLVGLTQAVLQPAHTPVQLIVLRKDHYLSPRLWDDLPHWATRAWRREVDAGHWLPLTQPAVLAAAVRDFLAFLDGGVLPDGLHPLSAAAPGDAGARSR